MTSPFTIFHVLISLVGIISGFLVMAGMIRDQPLGRANGLFLITTIATTVTGFMFPINGFTPAIGVGIVSMAVLCVSLLSLYRGRLNGVSRPAYAISATIALYLNIFVFIVQAFQKIPFLQGGDPAHPPLAFVVVQAAALIGFVVAGFFATKRFHPQGQRRALSQTYGERA